MATHDSEEKISLLHKNYDDSPFIVTYKDAALKMLYCNKMMCKYVGYQTQEQIVGKSDYDFRWEKFADLYSKHENVALSNKVYMAIFPVCDFEGKLALATCHRTPIFNSRNEAVASLTHTYLIYNAESLELSNILKSQEPENKLTSYTVGNQLSDVKLTKKEHECLFYFIRGKSCKAIAEILGISHRTVEDYMEKVKFKFGCHFKSELIEVAIGKGYLYNLPASLLNKRFSCSLKLK